MTYPQGLYVDRGRIHLVCLSVQAEATVLLFPQLR
jgi:hypothetical protein